MKTFILIFCLSFPALALADDAGQAQRQFFRKYCVTCHGATKQSGKVKLDDLAKVDAAVWEKVYEQLASESMPPDDKPQPTASERRAAVRRD